MLVEAIIKTDILNTALLLSIQKYDFTTRQRLLQNISELDFNQFHRFADIISWKCREKRNNQLIVITIKQKFSVIEHYFHLNVK